MAEIFACIMGFDFFLPPNNETINLQNLNGHLFVMAPMCNNQNKLKTY